jgi:hypothetical protein
VWQWQISAKFVWGFVCTQLLSNEWSHESLVLLGSSLFVLKWKTLPFQLWVTRMQLMLNICFFFPTLRFLATYSCYTLMSPSQQQLDHASHLLYSVKYMSRRRWPSVVLGGWFSQPNRYCLSTGY